MPSGRSIRPTALKRIFGYIWNGNIPTCATLGLPARHCWLQQLKKRDYYGWTYNFAMQEYSRILSDMRSPSKQCAAGVFNDNTADIPPWTHKHHQLILSLIQLKHSVHILFTPSVLAKAEYVSHSDSGSPPRAVLTSRRPPSRIFSKSRILNSLSMTPQR